MQKVDLKGIQKSEVIILFKKEDRMKEAKGSYRSNRFD